jgi:hypothetical protein
MHKYLKKRVWQLIEDRLSLMSFRAVKRRTDWVLFRGTAADENQFLVGEFFDLAGGKFALYIGLSFGDYPSPGQSPNVTLGEDPGRDFVMVKADSVGFPHALLSIELDWQTPSADLVNQALMLEIAKPILATLGVSSEARHHLLSHEVLEAFGVIIPDSEFDEASRRAGQELDRIIESSVKPALAKMREELPNVLVRRAKTPVAK